MAPLSFSSSQKVAVGDDPEPPPSKERSAVLSRFKRARQLISAQKRLASSRLEPDPPRPCSNAERMILMRKGSLSAEVVKEAMKKQSQQGGRRIPTILWHPAANFIAYWTIASILILCFVFITVPFLMCFDPELPTSYVVVDVLVDIFFLCDIAVNFRTGYYPNLGRTDLVIMDPEKIALYYLKSWFVPDLISGVPIATLTLMQPGVTSSTGNLGSALKLLKLGRILRLMKLIKVSSMSHRLDEFFLTAMVSMRGVLMALRFLKILSVGFLIVHYVACAWWACGSAQSGDHNSWAQNGGADDMSVWGQYLFSCYWVISTMTTVGYGDVSAMNDTERAFSIFAMILGGSFYGLLIAKITNIVAESENNHRVYSQRLDEIAVFVSNKGFAPALQRRVLQYYQKFLKKASTVDENQIIRELGSGIREKVVAHMLDTVVARGPFFSELGHCLIDLVPTMQMTLLDYGQYLTLKGQPSQEMICVVTGSAVMLDDGAKSLQEGNGEPVLPLFSVFPGAIFGERCVIDIDTKFSMTVRALTNCDCYVIDAEQFKAHIKPELVRYLRMKTLRSLAFRIRVRTYSVTMFESDAEKDVMEKVVKGLPPDQNKPTWNNNKSSQQQQHLLIQGARSMSKRTSVVGGGGGGGGGAGSGGGSGGGSGSTNSANSVNAQQVSTSLAEVSESVKALSLAVDDLRMDLLKQRRQPTAVVPQAQLQEAKTRAKWEEETRVRHKELVELLRGLATTAPAAAAAVAVAAALPRRTTAAAVRAGSTTQTRRQSSLDSDYDSDSCTPNPPRVVLATTPSSRRWADIDDEVDVLNL